MRLVDAIHRFNYICFAVCRLFFTGTFFSLRKIKIADSKKTINQIIKNRASMSRFGDGEFSLMSGFDTGFQKSDELIANKLKKIIKVHSSDNFIVGLPHPWKELLCGDLKYQAFEYWSNYLLLSFNTKIKPYIHFSQYYNASFTRFYIDYKTDQNARKLVPLIKKIWEDEDVIIVEGEYSRLGVGNDLFYNTKSIQRIICPATNAFKVYEEIIKEVTKRPKDRLVLIALGMTATCLAYDLYNLGYWAIDIGHVDVEYEWWKMGVKKRVPIRGKYVAEVKLDAPEDIEKSNRYYSEIISRIGI